MENKNCINYLNSKKCIKGKENEVLKILIKRMGASFVSFFIADNEKLTIDFLKNIFKYKGEGILKDRLLKEKFILKLKKEYKKEKEKEGLNKEIGIGTILSSMRLFFIAKEICGQVYFYIYDCDINCLLYQNEKNK